MRLKTKGYLRNLAVSASVLAVATGVPALAQGAGDTNDQPGIDRIVVTAQKVAEDVQDVPIAISVVTGDRLEQAASMALTG